MRTIGTAFADPAEPFDPASAPRSGVTAGGVPQPAGSLLVFTEAPVHCTLPWRGAGTGQVLLLEYSPGNSARSPSPPGLRRRRRPRATVEVVTDRQRRFFQPPSVGGHQPTIDP